MPKKPRSICSQEQKVKQPKANNGPLEILWKPRNERQREVEKLWNHSKIIIMMGPAGTGKTSAALGMAMRQSKRPLWLCRPAIDCDEDLGFEPGELSEKLRSWMAPFADVLGSMTNAKLDKLLSEEIEAVSAGRLRGRTVNGTLIVDEAQNLTRSQLKCILTRLGLGGKIVLCGDSKQSDLYEGQPPLVSVEREIKHLDGVETVWFEYADQCRDGLVSEIAKIL